MRRALAALALCAPLSALGQAPAPMAEREAAAAEALSARLERLRQGACGSPGQVFALRRGELIGALAARARAIGAPGAGSGALMPQLSALAEELGRACQSGEREMARRAAAR